MYHWIDNSTGEIRKNIWNVIIGDIQDAIWMFRRGYPQIRRKWRYSKKGW